MHVDREVVVIVGWKNAGRRDGKRVQGGNSGNKKLTFFHLLLPAPPNLFRGVSFADNGILLAIVTTVRIDKEKSVFATATH
jgi:hypothetical protein